MVEVNITLVSNGRAGPILSFSDAYILGVSGREFSLPFAPSKVVISEFFSPRYKPLPRPTASPPSKIYAEQFDFGFPSGTEAATFTAKGVVYTLGRIPNWYINDPIVTVDLYAQSPTACGKPDQMIT